MNLVDKRILADSSDEAPAVVAHAGGLVMAWRGSGNDQLNVMVSENGIDFVVGHKNTFDDSSDLAPALASHQGRLFIAWKGSGNDNLNVAELVPSALAGSVPVLYDLVRKAPFEAPFEDSSDHSPALASFGDRLVLVWKGSGNPQLNIATVRV
jgi:hypothetical protein